MTSTTTTTTTTVTVMSSSAMKASKTSSSSHIENVCNKVSGIISGLFALFTLDRVCCNFNATTKISSVVATTNDTRRYCHLLLDQLNLLLDCCLPAIDENCHCHDTTSTDSLYDRLCVCSQTFKSRIALHAGLYYVIVSTKFHHIKDDILTSDKCVRLLTTTSIFVAPCHIVQSKLSDLLGVVNASLTRMHHNCPLFNNQIVTSKFEQLNCSAAAVALKNRCITFTSNIIGSFPERYFGVAKNFETTPRLEEIVAWVMNSSATYFPTSTFYPKIRTHAETVNSTVDKYFPTGVSTVISRIMHHVVAVVEAVDFKNNQTDSLSTSSTETCSSTGNVTPANSEETKDIIAS